MMLNTLQNSRQGREGLMLRNNKKDEGEVFNFIIDCSDFSLERYKALLPEDYVNVFTKGDLNWCLQTYLILSKRGNLRVECSNSIKEGMINIIHSDQLLRLKGSSRAFIVCVRADFPQRAWAQYHLVQNQEQLNSSASFIPHWVQPGLIKRDPSRRGVSRVAYSGAPIRGNLAGSIEGWKRLFEPHGIEFEVLSSGCWHDLSQVDVLIGIRSFGRKPFHTKPATKLFSAWHANIPFVGGCDSAFRQLGRAGEDYLLACSAEEVLAAVLLLANDPLLYQSLVEKGQQKARLYTEKTIAEVWEKTLCGPVFQRFEQWKQRPSFESLRFQLMSELGGLEHRARRLVKSVLS